MKDEQGIESFVGRNAGYYRDKWQKFDDEPGSMASFNLAACLGQVIWLAYRKLYVPLFWAVAVLVAEVSLWLYLEDRQLISENLSTAWNWFATLLFLGVFGFLGNYWYWGKFLKAEQKAASSHSDRDAQLQFLRSKGGTSPVGAWAVVIVFILPIAWGGYWAFQGYRAGVVLDATGPLTLGEVQANFLNFMGEPLTGTRQECVFTEIEERARAAGDPESLNPATVEHLDADGWNRLDAQDKRFDLGVAIVTKALRVCGRSVRINPDNGSTRKAATGATAIIVAGDPRFSVFELANSAGDGSFASADGTVLMSFLARDSRYCRAARFSSDYTVVLACRNEDGWEIEATSSLAPGESTSATAFGGGDMTEVTDAMQTLNSSADFLTEREIIEIAGKGWR